MSRWPEPVRGELPIGQITEADIEEALGLTVAYLDDPEDPAFDPALFGFVVAVRAVLIECDDILSMNRAGLELARESAQDEPEYRRSHRIAENYAVQRISRRAINELRQWIPEGRS